VRRAVAAAALTGVVVTAAGCGTKSADLFEVERSGADRNANVNLVVNDDGTVSCNRGRSKLLPSAQLLTARELARQLGKQAQLAIELPPAKNSLLRYVVRTSEGKVAFSDTSAGKPKSFDRLAGFTKDVVEDICGIQR
jgi:hypothetical protein